MVDKRITEYTHTSNLGVDTMFELDRLSDSTGKISYLNLGLQIAEDVELARTYVLEKIDDDTFSLKSKLFIEKGINIPLLDGMLYDISPFVIEIPSGWQPNINPKIKYNDGDPVDIYNELYYRLNGSTDLDSNTFWDKGMVFRWSESLNAFLLYKKSKESGGYIVSDEPELNTCGMVKLDGTSLDPILYPNLSSLPEYSSGNIWDFKDASMCGYNGVYTVLNELNMGAINENETLSVSLNGTFWVTAGSSLDNGNVGTADGGFTKVTYAPIQRKYKMAVDIYNYSTEFSLTADPITTDINIGSQYTTLTKRRGMNFYRVI